MKKVISYLIGGLGNQMFQYATGLASATNNGAEFRVDKYAFSWYRRPFQLDSFRITTPYATRFDHLQLQAWSGRYSPLLKFDERRAPRERIVRAHKELYRFAPEFLDMGPRKKIFLVGYWQNERYFLGIRNRLVEEFRLLPNISTASTPLGKAITESESVAIHIRRGDNIGKPDPKNDNVIVPMQGMVTGSYLNNAMHLIQAQKPESRFFVFSDELEWVRSHMTFPYPVQFVENSDFSDVQQFELMSHCRHQITANSTFSWWAAWLNTNPEKIICAPKSWDARAHVDISELVPATWHLVE